MEPKSTRHAIGRLASRLTQFKPSERKVTQHMPDPVKWGTEDDYAEGGGLEEKFPPGAYLWKSCKFAKAPYEAEGVTGAAITMVPVDAKTGKPTGGEEANQFYSVGSGFKASKDGATLIPVGDHNQIRKSTNFYFFMIDHGIKRAKLDNSAFAEEGDISTLEGVIAKMVWVPAPDRGDMPENGAKSGLLPSGRTEAARAKRKLPKLVFVPESIIRQPGETSSKKKAADDDEDEAPKEKAKSKKKATADDDEAEGGAAELLGKYGKSLLEDKGAMTASRFRIQLNRKLQEAHVKEDVIDEINGMLSDAKLKKTMGKLDGFAYDEDDDSLSLEDD